MAKSNSNKRSGPAATTAFSKKNNTGLAPAKDNPSKIKPTKDADMDVMELDLSDGLVKLLTDGIKDVYWVENFISS